MGTWASAHLGERAKCPGPALLSSNSWGAEAIIRWLECLPWPPLGPPYLGQKLGPRGSTPTPTVLQALTGGVLPSIGLRVRGALRGGKGALTLSFFPEASGSSGH